jgi:hypothetical protein
MPENSCTADCTENPAKIERNLVKSDKSVACISGRKGNVTALRVGVYAEKERMGALGLEPRTYALKGRCSTS